MTIKKTLTLISALLLTACTGGETPPSPTGDSQDTSTWLLQDETDFTIAIPPTYERLDPQTLTLEVPGNFIVAYSEIHLNEDLTPTLTIYKDNLENPTQSTTYSLGLQEKSSQLPQYQKISLEEKTPTNTPIIEHTFTFLSPELNQKVQVFQTAYTQDRQAYILTCLADPQDNSGLSACRSMLESFVLK